MFSVREELNTYIEVRRILVSIDRAMAQAASRRPVIEEAKVHSQVSPCEIYNGQCNNGKGFSPRTPVFPCQYYSTITPHSLCLHVFLTRTIQAKPGSLPKSRTLPELGDHWVEKYFHFYFSLYMVDNESYKPEFFSQLCFTGGLPSHRQRDRPLPQLSWLPANGHNTARVTACSGLLARAHAA